MVMAFIHFASSNFTVTPLITTTSLSNSQDSFTSKSIQYAGNEAQHQQDPMERYALPNCTYRYDSNEPVIYVLSLYLDGPFTLMAALLAMVGANFAVKFLNKAGLNCDLTAALYTLCFCDTFLIFTVMLNHSIEATGILLTGQNVMWNDQKMVLYTHGLVSAATTASTLLVVFITFQRFLVVIWPLRYARVSERKRTDFLIRRLSSTKTRRIDFFQSVLLAKCTSRMNFVQSRKKSLSIVKRVRLYLFPVFVVFVAFVLNSTVFFEFELVDCFLLAERKRSQHLSPTPLRYNKNYQGFRTAIMMATQTVGPISVITLLTVITEYKVQQSLRARRCLFEAQQRRRSLLLVEELRERLSRTVAIFIAVKFLILRSLPIFFDIYETFYGIDSFGMVLTALVRLSDFNIVLNSATNSLAYFGKARWLEAKLRDRLLRKRQTPSASGRSSALSKAKPFPDYESKKVSISISRPPSISISRPSSVSPPPPNSSQFLSKSSRVRSTAGDYRSTSSRLSFLYGKQRHDSNLKNDQLINEKAAKNSLYSPLIVIAANARNDNYNSDAAGGGDITVVSGNFSQYSMYSQASISEPSDDRLSMALLSNGSDINNLPNEKSPPKSLSNSQSQTIAIII